MTNKNRKIISSVMALLAFVFLFGSYAAPAARAQDWIPDSDPSGRGMTQNSQKTTTGVVQEVAVPIPEYTPYEERIEDLQKTTWTNLNATPESCEEAIRRNMPCEMPGVDNIKLSSIGGVINLIKYITNWMFTILLVLAVLMIIIAAYHYLFSGGDEEGTGKAKKYLIYTVIALAVAMLSKGVTFIVAEVLMK